MLQVTGRVTRMKYLRYVIYVSWRNVLQTKRRVWDIGFESVENSKLKGWVLKNLSVVHLLHTSSLPYPPTSTFTNFPRDWRTGPSLFVVFSSLRLTWLGRWLSVNSTTRVSNFWFTLLFFLGHVKKRLLKRDNYILNWTEKLIGIYWFVFVPPYFHFKTI